MDGRPPIFVPGTPVQQGSKKPGPGMREDAGRKLYTWRETIGWAVVAAGWHRAKITTGPVSLRLVFTFPRLKSDPGREHKTSAPDLDKLIRAVGDALTQSGAYSDDAQVAEITATKLHGDTPGVLIGLYPITTHPHPTESSEQPC